MWGTLVDPPAIHSENGLDLVRRLLFLRSIRKRVVVVVCRCWDGRIEDVTVDLARQLEV